MIKKTKNVKHLIKGYKKLIKNSDLDKISQIQEKLSKENNLIKNKFLTSFFFPKNEDRNQVLINILLSKFGINKLREQLIISHSDKKFESPLPTLWLDTLKNENYNVLKTKSIFRFYFKIFNYYIYGVYLLIIFNFYIFKNFFKKDLDNFCFFNNTQKFHFPNKKSESIYNLFNFCKKNILSSNLKNVLYSGNEKFNLEKDKNTSFIQSEYPMILKLDFLGCISFFFHSIFLIFISLISLICGSWWNLFMLHEQPLRIIVDLKRKENLPSEVIFNLSDLYYRPLWTYNIEKKDSKIYMLWYSTNNQANYKKDVQSNFFYDWSNINWPINVVWNIGQKEWLERYIVSKKTLYFNYMWLSDYNFNIKINKNEKYLSVFNVPPFRISRYSIVNEDELDLHSIKNTMNFIENIIELSDKMNFKVLLKNKRSFVKVHHPLYKNLLERQTTKINIINENVSPIKMLENSFASINFPFTSTAYLSQNMNIPTCYYDPSGKIANFSFDKKITFNSSKKQLQDWLKNIL